ncbi:MAG: hypothetical protein BRC54_17160 [Cyanobacteria bacterium SW_7_48_12]|nr:MAG: hypothetical protein BRC54_17160 [Cyanobacteria bacterium SW_7_48_12]
MVQESLPSLLAVKPRRTDDWESIQECSGGRPRSVDLAEVANGIFYVLTTGCSWQMMPHDLPPSATCYHYFPPWQKTGVWQELNNQLRGQLRQQIRKEGCFHCCLCR